MIYDDVFLKSWDFQKLDSYQPGAAPLNQATMGWSAGAPCVHWHLTLGRMVIMVKRAGLSGVRMCQNMPNTWSKDKQTIGWYICICLYIYYYIYIYYVYIYIYNEILLWKKSWWNTENWENVLFPEFEKEHRKTALPTGSSSRILFKDTPERTSIYRLVI